MKKGVLIITILVIVLVFAKKNLSKDLENKNFTIGEVANVTNTVICDTPFDIAALVENVPTNSAVGSSFLEVAPACTGFSMLSTARVMIGRMVGDFTLPKGGVLHVIAVVYLDDTKQIGTGYMVSNLISVFRPRDGQ